MAQWMAWFVTFAALKLALTSNLLSLDFLKQSIIYKN